MTNKTKYLSQREREISKKYFLNFAGWNGMGFSFLGNTSVYLLAILYGANNLQLGYISSAVYISGIALVFYPKLFNGKSTKSVGTIAWLIRGLVSIGYFFLPLLQGQQAVFLILLIYTLFCITRTIGVAIQQTIQKMISTNRTRGDIVLSSSTRFNSIAIFSRFISFLITSISQLSELFNLLILQFLGIISNTIASLNLKAMPNREYIEYRPGRHVGKIFVEAMRDTTKRSILLLKWGAICIEILGVMTIPFLRQFADFSAGMIFLYTLIITFAAISASLAIRPFADRLGSRPFILPISILMSLTFLIWIFIDENSTPQTFFILGFLTIFLQNILSLLAYRLFIQSIPDEDSTAYTSMDIFITSIIALFLGTLAGGLADFSLTHNIPYINHYGLTFIIGVILSLGLTLIAASFMEEGSATLKKSWTMLLSYDHLKTFIDINRLNGGNTTFRKKTLLLSLGYTGSSLASDEIRQIFASPLSIEKSEIIKTLFERKRPELIPDLIKEAQNPHSQYKIEAIFALGAYPDQRVEKALVRLLQSKDSLTAANAAKSLGRINHKESIDLIYERFISGKRGNLERDLSYLIALHHMAPNGNWLQSIITPESASLGQTYQQAIYTLLARQLNYNPPLGWIFQQNNLKKYEGFTILLDETREIEDFLIDQENLKIYYQKGNFKEIFAWCSHLLEKYKRPSHINYISQSIQNFDYVYSDSTNSIAALYFTYQIISKESQI